MLFPLAAFEGIGENSRQGSATRKTSLHRGRAWSNSARALGIEEVLVESCVGYRSSGNSSGGFFSGIKDKFLDFLARNANYLPGVCTAGAFGFGTGGAGNASGGAEFGGLVDKQIGKPATVQPLGEVSYGPVGVGGTPSEALVFVQPAPKVPAGFVFAANPQNGFINNSGISIGFFAGKFGHGKGLAGGAGGGAYLTFSSAANCLKNF